MQTNGPPDEGHTQSLDTRNAVAGKRRRRKRTRSASALRRVHAKSRERQAIWSSGIPRPATVEGLTVEIGEAYRDVRFERRMDPLPAYAGATMRLDSTSERTR